MANRFCALLISTFCLYGDSDGLAVSIQTNVGEIIGFTDTVSFSGTSKNVTKFLGIPFAKAPMGPLRFRKPVPREKFAAPHNASAEGPACPQDPRYFIKGLQTSEDCLFLNINVPGFGSGVIKRRLPVMVWIYGGGFIVGATRFYDGSILSAFNDVIVVTVSYRVSVFGFLAIRNSSALGNYGLWDQHLALKWVHNNIGSFGGDPGKVTIFGESAGSASVMYQALYPGNSGLFQRVIGQSGVALSPWAFSKVTLATAPNLNRFTSNLHCSSVHPQNIVDCLRNKSTAELMDKHNFHDSDLSIRTEFIPVVDGEFLQMAPDSIFKATDPRSVKPLEFFRSLDIMSGMNSMDGGSSVLGHWEKLVESYTNKTLDHGCPRNIFDGVIIPAVTSGIYYDKINLLNEAVSFMYTDWSNPYDVNRTCDMLMDFTTDYTYFIPTIRTLDAHAQNNSKATYFYQFSHRPSYDTSPAWVTGASHATDLGFTFGFPSALVIAAGFKPSDIHLPSDEIKLSTRMMKMLTDFAKSGDPKGQNTGNWTWPMYNSRSRPYLNLDIRMDSMMTGLRADKVAFWLDFVPVIVKSMGQTHGNKQEHTNFGNILIG